MKSNMSLATDLRGYVSSGELTEQECKDFMLQGIEKARVDGRDDIKLEIALEYMEFIGQ